MEITVFQTIQNRLKKIESDHGVEILFAVESGSRAWGFESLDSDYDIRFIYRRPLEQYLSLTQKRDVIEYPIEDLLDFAGWDIKKALFLLGRSNPTLFEWLHSPMVYFKNEEAFSVLLSTSAQCFSKTSVMLHYLHMAKSNYRDNLQDILVKSKKYFYVLRPVLSCMWIEKNGAPPPLDFITLLNDLSIGGDLRRDIDALLVRKKSGIEGENEPKIPSINNFLNHQIHYFESNLIDEMRIDKPGVDFLDSIFLKLIQ